MQLKGARMERITIGFYPEIYEKLEERAKQKNLKVSQYVRQLVDLGLRIEEMSEQKSDNNTSTDPIEKALAFQQKLLQKEFLSSHETLYLVRYLLANSPEKNSGDHSKMLEAAKMKAQSLLEVLNEETA